MSVLGDLMTIGNGQHLPPQSSTAASPPSIAVIQQAFQTNETHSRE